MPARKGLLAPQNTFLDTIATRFDGTHSNFVLGNAKIAKVYPIVYCSDGFCELTGYSRAQIMQKSCACNFLYGTKTDLQHRDAITNALEAKQELKLEVILYRGTGTPFWCLLDIVPIQDEKHEVVLFLCSHKDITRQKLHEHKAALQQQLQQHKQAAEHQQQHPAEGDQQQQQQQDKEEQAADKQAPNANRVAYSTTSVAPNDHIAHDQQALISLDEFKLNELPDTSADFYGHQGDDDAEFERYDDDDESDQEHSKQDKNTASQYSRRRSRAVLYQLSGHYGYRRSVNMKSKLKLNNRMTIPEYKTTTIEKQKFIVSHYGLWKSCWDWLILIVSFYVAIVVPYNATFKEKLQPSSGVLGLGQAELSDQLPSGGGGGGECEIDSFDIFVEVVFIIDVILNFRTTFVNRKGEVVTRPRIISKHYIKGWFVVDACAALPFDLLCGLNLYSRSRINIDLNLLKLIRLLRLARLLQKMDRYSQYSYIILTLLMLIFSLLAHWCACIWYVIAMEELDRYGAGWKLGWINQLSDKLGYNVVNATDMASSYITALYFTTSSLTSVGFGNVSANTNPEKIFSIVIMLIGALMHAVVFGNVTALIRVMYARRSNYQTRLRDLKDFFRLHQLPKDLQQRMSDYFQTTWSLNHGIDTYEILKDFPDELRGDVSLHLHREVLSLPIFASAPQGFLKSLARHIESKFCCPTEYLIHRGDALCYLYLVCNGSMEVLQDNMVVGILGKGDLVGYDVNASPLTPDHTTQFAMSTASFAPSSALGALSQQLPQAGGSCLPTPNVTSAMLGVGKTTGGGSGGCLVKSSSDLKALTYCDLKCIHIGGLLEVLKLYPEFSDTFHEEIVHDLSFNLREQHEEHGEDDEDEDEDEEDEDDDDDGSPSGGARGEHRIGRYDGDGDEDAPPERAATRADQQSSDDEQEDDELGSPSREARTTPSDDDDHQHSETVVSTTNQQQEPASLDGKRRLAGSLEQLTSALLKGRAKKLGGVAASAASAAAASAGPLQDSDGESSSLVSGCAAAGSRWARHGTFAARHANTTANDDDRGERNWKALGGEQRFSYSHDVLVEPQGGVAARRARLASASKHGATESGHEDEEDEEKGDKFSSALGHRLMVSKNNSDDQVLASAQSKRNAVAPRAPLASVKPLRSAIGIPGSATGGARAQKPPISFDLSRNTTAVVDRRRRSAGCIQRPLAISTACASAAAAASAPGYVDSPSAVSVRQVPTCIQQQQQPGAATRRHCHSSLIHIGENEPMVSPATGGQTRATQRRSPRGVLRAGQSSLELLDGVMSAAACAKHTAGVSARPHFTSSYSSQDFMQIDAHITASVRKLRQEFRQELNSAIESLARLIVERRSIGALQHSGASSAELVAAAAAPCGGAAARRKRAANATSRLEAKSRSSNGSAGSSSLSRSVSAVSFTVPSAGDYQALQATASSSSGALAPAGSPPARNLASLVRRVENSELRELVVVLQDRLATAANGSASSTTIAAERTGCTAPPPPLVSEGGRPARLCLIAKSTDELASDEQQTTESYTIDINEKEQENSSMGTAGGQKRPTDAASLRQRGASSDQNQMGAAND